MSAEFSQEQQVIQSELAQARAHLDALSEELRGVDAELDAISGERTQYELLGDICASLEKLDETGGSDLFWSGLPGADFSGHVRRIRDRADEFGHRIDEIETRRTALLGRMSEVEDASYMLEDDLAEVRFQEEMKKLEWVPEREDDSPIFNEGRMPWTHGGEEDKRYRKALLVALLMSISFGLLMPLIPIPEPDPWAVVEIPDRLTRLIKEEPPPPPVVQEQLEPQKTQPETPEEPEQVAQDTKPKETPKPKVSKAVAQAGILALRDEFAALAADDPASRLGTSARISRAGESAAGQRGRSLVTTQSPGSSGGIDVGSLGRSTVGGGGQALEGVQVARATSSIGTGGGNDRPLSGGPGLSRTDEEIQIVFDRHKSALYRLYNRALRRNPTLQGQIVLKLVIEADGSVSLCEVKSSDMDAPDLAAKVVERVKLFDFGAKEGIPPVSILYPIDFLPAA